MVVTGCWATSNRAAAEAIPGVDAVIGHHQDVAFELIRLLDLWQGGAAEKPADCPNRTPAPSNQPGDGVGFSDAQGLQTAATAHQLHDNSNHCLEITNFAGLTSEVTQKTNHHATPEPLRNEGWIDKAGSPAGTLTDRITLFHNKDVNEKMGGDVSSNRPPLRPGTTALPLLSSHQTGRQRAHLKIQDGCDAHCTYCIIPRLRPGLWSKPVTDAVAEARQLVAAGHVELVLTGIFLGAYGQPTALRRRRTGTHDVSGQAGPQNTPLAQLTDALCTSVPGLRRLRFSSLEPGDLDANLIAVLRSHPQIVPHFHLPLQSGSNLLLRRMNRQYTRDDFLHMIDSVCSAFDRPAVTTDIIVGFPGETEAEFERTLEVARHSRFIHIHAFPFSPRPGTAAARWTGQFVPGAIVNQRIEVLRSRSEADSLAYRRQFVGEIAQVLVEREKDEVSRTASPTPADATLRHGRCERYFQIHFRDPAARPGDFAGVRIDHVQGEETMGTRIA